MSIATTAVAAVSSTSPTRRPRSNVEAARYTVLRRLAPTLKHDMVVHLQAVSMLAEVLGAKLEKDPPSPAELRKSLEKIQRLARDGIASCLKVASRIAPGDDEGVLVHEGVDECLALLRSTFIARGFSLQNEVPALDFQVSRTALYQLLPAAMILLSDAARGPSDIMLGAEISAGFSMLTVHCTPRPDDKEYFPRDDSYRQLEWPDVQAMAAAESVVIFRTSDQIVMLFPRLVTHTALQIAPM